MTESIPPRAPNEMGPTETKAFSAKVTELIRHPKITDNGNWTTHYRKKNEPLTCSLLMPAPGTSSTVDLFSVVISKLIFTTEQGHSVTRETTLNFHPNLKIGGTTYYSEKDVVYDQDGKIVPKPSLSIEEHLQKTHDLHILEANVATLPRYRKVMSVLNALTPDEEAVDE